MAITNSESQLANLGPLAQLTAGRLPERILRLVIGLWLYGLSIALMIEGAVGAAPWDVFHVGVARHRLDTRTLSIGPFRGALANRR